MRLSIVIPAYNEEAYLTDCLDAVMAEASAYGADAEVIVVDNASTDNTYAIAAKYPRVKVVQEMNKGLLFARQAGYLAATGDLIANIDADTIMPEGWIGKVMLAFKKNPRLVALSGPYYYYDLPLWQNACVHLFYFLGFINHLVMQFIFHKGAMLQGGNFVLKRWALKQVGGFNLDLDFYGEDTDMAIRMQKMGWVRFSFGLRMPSSGRRLKGEGVFTMGIKYALNHIWPMWLGRAYTKEYKDIRK